MMQGTTIAKTNQKTSLFSRVMPLGGELSAGLRFGGASGLTIKKYNKNNKSALELVTAFNFFNVFISYMKRPIIFIFIND